jgi:transmembrane sensor
MTDPAPPSTNDVAAHWVVRRESGPLSEAEEREFNAWLEAAPHHPGALIRAEVAWQNMDRLGAMAGAAASRHSTHALADKIKTQGARPFGSSNVRGRTRFVAATVASAAAVAIVVSFVSVNSRAHSYAADVGEVRRITLEDGSGVVLNSDSKVSVRFRDTVREVRLERGEAIFEVAKNKTRPFIVLTDAVSVRAVGTAFSVRRADGAVSVAVTEGVVEVTQPATLPQRVSVDERAMVRPRQEIEVRRENRSTLERQLAWRTGMISFAGESLADAVNEVNRYSRRKIEIDDPSLRTRPVIGIFRVGDVDAFAQGAAAALGAEIEWHDSTIRLVATKQHLP